jgi:hypothetical protein
MLDRLAVYLGEGNSLCDLPPNIPAGAPIAALQAGFDATVATIAKLTGARAFDPQINALKNSINAAFDQATALAQQADDAKERLEAVTRVISHQAEFIAFIGSYVDKSGAARQDVAYSVYLLKKYGGFTTEDAANANQA